MVEKIFHFSIADGTTSSIQIGLSGIIKRIRISKGNVAWAIAAGNSGSYLLGIHPIVDSVILDGKHKFYYREGLSADAASTARDHTVDTRSVDVNFYVDKNDYLILRNVTGASSQFNIYLDIFPVTDKTRLYLGGEYHN